MYKPNFNSKSPSPLQINKYSVVLGGLLVLVSLILVSGVVLMAQNQDANYQSNLPAPPPTDDGIPANTAETFIKNIDVVYGVDYVKCIIGLNHLPDKLYTQDTDPNQMTLVFNGKLAADLPKKANLSVDSNNLSQVYYDTTPDGKRVQFFIKRTVPKSARITKNTINVTPQNDRKTGYNYQELILTFPKVESGNVKKSLVSEGLTHWTFKDRNNRGPLFINVLQLDLSEESLMVQPVLANMTMGYKMSVQNFVRSEHALAGINGSFFKPDVGITLGMLVVNDELITGPLFGRATFGLDNNGKAHMDRVNLHGFIEYGDGKRVPINTLNQPRARLDHTVLYTPFWGKKAPNVPKKGYQVLIQNNKVTHFSQTTPLTIPVNGFVVSGPNTKELKGLSDELDSGRPVNIVFYTLPDWSAMRHAIAGGPLLLKDRKNVIDARAEQFSLNSLGAHEPRTAIGITRDNHLLMVTVDGRQKGTSVGMSLNELAQLMASLGAVDAMNLDGGSSTQMVVGNRLTNKPSSGGGVAVSTALVVMPSNK